MNSLSLLLLFFTIVLSSSKPIKQSLFVRTPHDTQRLIFSYLPQHQYSARLLSERTHSLFDGLHATIKQWIELKTFLLDLQTNETSFVVDSFESQLSQKCAFLKPFKSNYTQDQIVKIEKLLCILINNEKIQPAKVKRTVSKTLNDILFGSQHNSNPHNISNLRPLESIHVMMFMAIGNHNFDDLAFLWNSAKIEMNKTGNMDNRYTLAALGVVRSYTRKMRAMRQISTSAQSIADRLWEYVPLAFVHYYLSFDELLWYRIKKRRLLIVEIINHAFSASDCGILNTQYLELFCLGNSVLWDLGIVMTHVTLLRNLAKCYWLAADRCYYWEKMKKLIEWILEHKVTDSNAPHFAHLLMRYDFLSVNSWKRITVDELRFLTENQPNIRRVDERKCCQVM